MAITGLGDSHIHVILDGEDYKKAISMHRDGGPVDLVIRDRLKQYKDAGVTFVRDGGDSLGVCNRAKMLAPEFGIDYRTPGFPIYKKGHYGGFLGCAYETIDDYRNLVEQAKNQGADFIKIMISGIMDFDNFGKLIDGKFYVDNATDMEADNDGIISKDEITDLINIAHDNGFAVMAHCNGAASIAAAIEAGVDSLEHGAYMNDYCVSLLAESDTVWIPTISPIANLIGEDGFNDAVLKEIVKSQINNVHKAWNLGAMIGLGTDAGAHRVLHTHSISSEYNYLKAAIDDFEFDAHLKMSQAQIEWKFKM